MSAIDAVKTFQTLSGHPVQDVILVVMIGDSQASAAGLQASSTLKTAGNHSRALVAYNSGTFNVSTLAHRAGSRLGWHSMGPSFADRFYELTGLGTLWVTDIPTGGVCMLRSLNPAFNFDFSGMPGAANGNRLFLTDGSINLDTVVPRTLQYIANAMPGFRLVNKILMNFDGHSEVADGFRLGTCTQAEVIDYHEAMIDYWEAQWGFEKLVLFPPGFVGNTPAELAADVRRWDLARAATIASCDGARVLNGCTWLDQFEPLVVDGNGDHVSGAYKYDLSHYSGETNDAIGRGAAQILATAMGY